MGNDGTKVIDFRQAVAERASKEDPLELSVTVEWTARSYHLTVTDYTTSEDPGPGRLRDAAQRLRFIADRLDSGALREESEEAT